MSEDRSNNLDAIRLLAASAVVLGHSFVLVGEAPYGAFGHSVSTLAVLVFFSLSGYLIARSWMNDPHPAHFAFRRARRILPALAGVVLFCAFVLGPALSPMPLREYLTHPQTIRYLGNAFFYVSYSLPYVFADNPFPHAVNGSLWTLPVEVSMYALTPLWVLLGRWWPALLICLAVLIGLTVYALVFRPSEIVIAAAGVWSGAQLAPYFVAGVMIARYDLERFLDVRIGLLALAALHIAPLDVGAREAVLCILLPYAVIAAGLRSWPVVRRFGRFGDASYGIYLWSFPVQQTIAHFLGTSGGGWANFAIAIPTLLGIAFVSWHLLEKRTLRWGIRSAVLQSGPPGLALGGAAARTEGLK